MKFIDWIRNVIFKISGNEKLPENPKSSRLTYISNQDDIELEEVRCGKVWYIGDSNELHNYYLNRKIYGLAKNPVYNRNIANYFWAKSVDETDIKRVHSGMPRAIIDTLSNCIGMPQIDEASGIWDKIAEENDFETKLTQQSRPLTFAEGYGGWKVNFDKSLSKHPIWEYYDGENCEYIIKSGIMIGMIFKSFYKNDKGKDYVLFETRYRKNGNSYIEYGLYKVISDTEMQEADQSEIRELTDVDLSTIVIEGLDDFLAVESRYLYDVINPKHGKPLLAGKYDLLDMLDEVLSQASQTNRVSTPVEYYSADVIFRDKEGNPSKPNLYNRQFMQKESIPDGDGNINNDIITTQPDLNFDKYGALCRDILDYVFIGLISPASMGIDVAKKDNADAQREKEKITLLTRDSIINPESRMIKKIVKLSLYMQEYMDTGTITLNEPEISVKYNQFANPAFETMLEKYGSAWVNGEMSTQKYVELLWADKMTDEEMQQEIAWLDENRAKDDFSLEGMMNNGMEPNISEPSEQQEEVPAIEE